MFLKDQAIFRKLKYEAAFVDYEKFGEKAYYIKKTYYDSELSLEGLSMSVEYPVGGSYSARLIMIESEDSCDTYGILTSNGVFEDSSSGLLSLGVLKKTDDQETIDVTAQEILSEMIFTQHKKDNNTSVIISTSTGRYKSVNK